MIIKFKRNKLAKTVASPKAIMQHYGTRAKLVYQRLQELKAAANLEVMRTLPKAKCHALTGDRKGEFAVDISANHRIIFTADNASESNKEGGGIIWTEITAIIILDIGEDYH